MTLSSETFGLSVVVFADELEFINPDDFVFAWRESSPYERDWITESVLYPTLDAAGNERRPREHGYHLFRPSCGSILDGLTSELRRRAAGK